MSQISEALQAIINSPEDLSSLPTIVAQVQDLEKQGEDYQLRLGKLQQYNHSLLSQIPIPGSEPPAASNEDEEKINFEDAQEQLMNALTNVRG